MLGAAPAVLEFSLSVAGHARPPPPPAGTMRATSDAATGLGAAEGDPQRPAGGCAHRGGVELCRPARPVGARPPGPLHRMAGLSLHGGQWRFRRRDAAGALTAAGADRDTPVYFLCRSGARSRAAAIAMAQAGFARPTTSRAALRATSMPSAIAARPMAGRRQDFPGDKRKEPGREREYAGTTKRSQKRRYATRSWVMTMVTMGQ